MNAPLCALAAALLVLPRLPAEAIQEDPLPGLDPVITRAELEHHVRILAADVLEGRRPATRGMERAAQYLARALAAAGVEPAGDDSTFFQNTGFKRFEYPALPRLLFTDEAGATVEARYGVDFTLKVRGKAHSTEKLLLRFFYDYNHSRMPLVGIPDQAMHFSAFKEDRERIFDKLGIADLADWGLEVNVVPGDVGLEPGKPVESMPARTLVEKQKESDEDGCEVIELRGPLRPAFERRKFTHVQLLVEEVEAPFADSNVVGRIRGVGTKEHPEMAEEVVLLSAHYDHLGIRPPSPRKESEDRICNGADDDASGCAALLELAQAFAAGEKPARTLVFLFTTGAENGGVGSHRYVENPVEPLARTVANLNLEMLGRPDELAGGAGHLWLTGFERTNLGPAWRSRSLAIVADPRPRQKFFQRWDSHTFALEGVVAQTLSSFALRREHRTPRDEADTLDYAHLEAAARVAYEAARTLADGTVQPAWLPAGPPLKPGALTPSMQKTEEELDGREEEQGLEERHEGDGSGDEDQGEAKDER